MRQLRVFVVKKRPEPYDVARHLDARRVASFHTAARPTNGAPADAAGGGGGGKAGGGARLNTEIVIAAHEFEGYTFGSHRRTAEEEEEEGDGAPHGAGGDETDHDIEEEEVTLVFNYKEVKALVSCSQKLDAAELSFYFTAGAVFVVVFVFLTRPS